MSFRSNAPLPADVIDRLFSALIVRYGTAFTDRWRDLDLDVVKSDWARELSAFSQNLPALKYGLDNLTEKPPTVIEFKRSCGNAPAPQSRTMLESDAPVRGPNEFEKARLRELRGMFRAQTDGESA